MTIHVDKEFASLIPPLSADELAGLEASIKAEGCRDALVVWKTGSILLDGHNRKRICDRMKFVYETTEIDLPDRDSAKDWIETNQLARRNLTAEQRALLIGHIFNRKKGKQGGTGANQYTKQKGQNEPSANAAESVAKEFGVSPATVKRDGKFAEVVDANPELKAAVNRKESAKKVMRDAKEKQRERRRGKNRKMVESTPTIETAVESGPRFATILMDPPWDWGDEGDVDQLGRARPTYDTMPLESIRELPIRDIADVDCHLYMWITNRSLPKGFSLLDSWGFRHITMLTWPKPSFGMGNYFRGQTEHVLFGVKGSQMLKRKNASTLLPSWKRGKGHSAKPVEFYQFVESCSPGPYLEMFSRSKRDGWTTWGAEV
jgi:N6-adenosine-specific RNA methylase IME4